MKRGRDLADGYGRAVLGTGGINFWLAFGWSTAAYSARDGFTLDDETAVQIAVSSNAIGLAQGPFAIEE